MKMMKNVLSLFTALVMVFGLSLTVYADGGDGGTGGATPATTGTIEITNATIGLTYTAYKIFNATLNSNNTGIAYTATETQKNFYENKENNPFDFTKNSDNSYYVTKKTGKIDTDVISFFQSFITGSTPTIASDFSAVVESVNTKIPTSNTVTFNNLNFGYYFVTSSLGSVVTIDSTTPSATIKDKNTQGPDGPSKVITAENAVIATSDQPNISDAELNDAAVGSTERFKITYNATNWVTTKTGNDVTSKKVEKFYIKDTPTNMTIKPSTITVKVGETEIWANSKAKNSETNPITVSVADGDAGKLEIVIDWVNSSGESIYSAANGQANIPVTLTYNATILAGAATQNASNTVGVEYHLEGESNNISIGADTTSTKTYCFSLAKVDFTDDSPLTGAKFELTLGNTKVSFIDVNGLGKVYRVAGAGETGVTTIDMKNNSTVEIRGLDKQDYTLTEIQAPDGYNLLTDSITIKDKDLKEATDSLSTATVKVKNKQGTELPSTGGMGTTLFYTAGSVLVVGAGILMITRKRMESCNE